MSTSELTPELEEQAKEWVYLAYAIYRNSRHRAQKDPQYAARFEHVVFTAMLALRALDEGEDAVMDEYQLPSGHVFMGLTYFSRGPAQDSLVTAKCSCGWTSQGTITWMTGMNHEERLKYMGVEGHLERARGIHEHGERHLTANLHRILQP